MLSAPIFRFDCLGDLAIDHDFDLAQALSTYRQTLDMIFPGSRLGLFEGMARRLPIDLRQEHRAGGDKTPAGAQTLHPAIVREPVRQSHVDSPKTERNRMDP